MKSMPLTELVPGMVSENELYSEKGELLIAKGVTISDRIISLMEKRNVFTLYYRSKNEIEELDRLIAGDFQKFDPLDFGTEPAIAGVRTVQPASPHVPIRPPKLLESPELRAIKSGKQGYTQLLHHERALELDKLAKLQVLPDKPFGVPIDEKATQIPVGKRTEAYKTEVTSSYQSALDETVKVLTSLADGSWCDARRIRTIVERFVKLFVTDRCVLLNISGTKHADEYVFHHSLNVCLLSINIAAAFGYNEQQIAEIGMGALLHDIGMLLIPDHIRFKVARLSVDERFEIQKHPILGLHLLEKVKNLPPAVPYVAYHAHERENGRGYPKQRNGRLIHGFAKVVQIADMYEAMCSPRPYRAAMIPFRAMAHLIFLSRTGVVSPGILKAFLKYVSLFPVGSLVELSDNTIGKVVQSNGTSYSKPIISILANAQGGHLSNGSIYQIDLSGNSSLSIIKALPYDHLGDKNIMEGF
ncbi:MAG: HD domain-containing protein [Chitinispirillaceae bacterium]|nr:HD domain-containing protein [Chitinispirillaceae bacterium]